MEFDLNLTSTDEILGVPPDATPVQIRKAYKMYAVSKTIKKKAN